MSFNVSQLMEARVASMFDPMSQLNAKFVQQIVDTGASDVLVSQANAASAISDKLAEAKKNDAPESVIRTYEKLLKKLEDL